MQKERTYKYTLDGLINRRANNIGIISLLAIGWAYTRGGGGWGALMWDFTVVTFQCNEPEVHVGKVHIC